MLDNPLGQKFVSITIHIPLGPLYSTQLTDPSYQQGSLYYSCSSSSNNDQGSSSANDQQGSSSNNNDDPGHQVLKSIGLCPPGHHCACTSGVFHDYDATDRFSQAINNGCTSDKG